MAKPKVHRVRNLFLEEEYWLLNFAYFVLLLNWKGIRDDLTLLLNEDMNSKLAELGPRSIKKDYIRIKDGRNKNLEVTKNHIKVASISEDIVDSALLIDKLEKYITIPAAEDYLLKKVGFCEEIKKEVPFLFGPGFLYHKVVLCYVVWFHSNMVSKPAWKRHSYEIMVSIKKLQPSCLEVSKVELHVHERLKYWEDLSSRIEENLTVMDGMLDESIQIFAAQIQKGLFRMVATMWRNIAMIVRETIFEEEGADEIDVFDLKCKEWGFHLHHTFGPLLGTGDYGHLIIEHASMLMRTFGSMREFSNQGFESSHKVDRRLYQQATNHNIQAKDSSVKQILTHVYVDKLLFLRLSLKKALECFQAETDEECVVRQVDTNEEIDFSLEYEPISFSEEERLVAMHGLQDEPLGSEATDDMGVDKGELGNSDSSESEEEDMWQCESCPQ
ncbi:Hypothetical predicted protein [Paramuricea clavata]|uniref:Uncharacterized protein n=1 Tax=Paramuricea clavata TaxID=317549 RepID=A0A7D9DDG4_PARCT|nr:Hypothetical predicted protein [Paramuricea clavata]